MLVHHAQISKKIVKLFCYSTVLHKSEAMLMCIHKVFPCGLRPLVVLFFFTYVFKTRL